MGSSAEAPIDLTVESDDESGPLISTMLPSSPTQKSAPLLPGDTPRLPTAIPFPASQLSVRPLELPRSKSEERPPYMAANEVPSSSKAPTAKRPRNGTGYIPVFPAATPGEEADDLKIPRAEKRLKISMPEVVSESKPLEPLRRRKKPAPRFYGVQVGHVPGVYTDWPTVLEQIKGCKGAKHQRFNTREEAQAFVNKRLIPRRRQPFTSGDADILPVPMPFCVHPVDPSLTVPDAKLYTNGLPSVQTLNTALKSNGTSIPSARDDKLSYAREIHLGRVSDAASGTRVTEAASESSAMAQVLANGKAVDQEYHTSPPRIMFQKPPVERGTPSIEHLSETQHGNSKENRPPTEDPLSELLEDDIYLELLSEVTANDKIALLLHTHPRGQLVAQTVRDSHTEKTSGQNSPRRTLVLNPESPPAASLSDRDSVFSVSETMHAKNTISSLSPAPQTVTTVEQPLARKKWTGGLSEAEAHLLIFLKEVKRLKWSEITAKFKQHYPNREYGILQTNYSQKINRRDKSQDPSTLILPSCYASEAQIDWVEVHANLSQTSGYVGRQKRETNTIQEETRRPSAQGAASALPTAVGSLQDQSSGGESTSHYKRPRRAVPVKNYTWPRRNAQLMEDSFDDTNDDFNMLGATEERSIASETPEDIIPAPEKAVAVDNEPVSVEFDQDDAFLALVAQNPEATSGKQQLPYLSSSQRSDLQNVPRGYEWDQLISRDWQGTLIHVDFSPKELDLVEETTMRLLNHQRVSRSRSQRRRLHRLLNGLLEPTLLRLGNALRSKLHSRDRRSINAFLQDAKGDKIRCAAPRIERLAASRPKSFTSEAKSSMSSMIRRRETGIQSHRGWSTATRPLSYQLKNKVYDSLGPVCSYTGASSDVHAVAWSVDGQCFAAAAICVDDPHSMQYNRPNNLLYGDVSRNTIHELGTHHILRPKPASGPNSTHAMYASQDPRLFKTVSSVAFYPNGRFMFSGGWDQNVCVWETKNDGSQPIFNVSWRHKSEVNLMAVNASGVLATATRKRVRNAVKVLHLYEDDPLQPPHTRNFSSEKAAARPDLNIQPTALHFSPRYENLLLGGFGAHVRQDGRDTTGDICLWDINGNKQLNLWGSGKNVFDLSFHPRERWFAVATVAGQNANRGTRSTVRLYSEQDKRTDVKFSSHMELECRALDINDVVWCPGDDNLVAAGCTSGRAYVWDVRYPNHFLRELAHGSSLAPLDDDMDRELTDTGIRFLSWGENATRLYTGSSDGVVKVWNVARSEEETFVKDLITVDSGVMSGAFSPDRSRLLLGEVNGSVNVLEVGRDDCILRDVEKMRYIPYKDYDDDDDDMQSSQFPTTATDSGIAYAKELLETSQMIIKPMGGLPIKQAVQGPSYAGPYDMSEDAPSLRKQALEMQLRFSETPTSHCSVCLSSDSNPIMITREESGDSGRSVDRIPDELRLQWKAGPVKLKAPPGKAPCSRCGRVARPSDQSHHDGTSFPPKCERCAFTCVRCDSAMWSGNLRPETEIFECPFCNRVWEIGALGYDLVKDSDSYPHPRWVISQIPELEGYKKDLRLKKSQNSLLDDANSSFGDEMNALTDYYFSLTIDRTGSPPL